MFRPARTSGWVEKAAVFFFLCGFLAQGMYYALDNPLFSKPDEIHHYAYVIYLRAGHGLPVVDTTRFGPDAHTAVEMEGHQPPIYYATVAAIADVLGLQEKVTIFYRPDYFWKEGVASRVPTPGLLPIFFAGRFVSLTCSVVALLSIYLLVRLFAPWPLAWLSMAFVGLNPQFVFIATSFSNDMASVATTHLGLWLLGNGVKNGLSWRHGVMVGIVIGLGTLTKLTGLGLLLPFGVIALGQARKRNTLGPLLLAGLIVLIMDSWWFWRNWLLYRNPFATNLLTVLLGSRTGPWSRAEVQFFFENLWKSYWLDFSPGTLLMAEPAVYWCLGGMFILSVAGSVMAIQREKTLRPLFFLTWGWFWIVFVSFLRLTKDTAIFMGGGRLLFPAAVAIGLTTAVGLTTLFRQRLAIPLLVILTLGTYAGIAPARYFGSYPVMRLIPPPNRLLLYPLPDTAYRVEKSFQNGLQLLAYEMQVESLGPGKINLVLYWRTESQPDRKYRVFVQLGPQDPSRHVAGEDVWLGGTLYPSDLWRAGDIVRQIHHLSIPDWAPAPGLYWLRIGVYSEETGRIPLQDGPGDMVVLGPWRLLPAGSPPAPACVTDYRLGDAIRLKGYDLAWEQEGDQRYLAVTLQWQAVEEVGADYTAFVHLLDGEGRLVAQHDGPPRGGEYPTSWWRVGEQVPDTHRLLLERLPEGPLSLQVGMYHPETLARLPAYDQTESRLPADVVPLARIWTDESGTLQFSCSP
jgi:hypothetical protein